VEEFRVVVCFGRLILYSDYRFGNISIPLPLSTICNNDTFSRPLVNQAFRQPSGNLRTNVTLPIERDWDASPHSRDCLYCASFIGLVSIPPALTAGNICSVPSMQAWLDSEGHCSNLMTPAFAEIGAAFAEGQYLGNPVAPYWTFDLATHR
jgi:hypothetical protein